MDPAKLQRLEALFPRYWDSVLTPAELEEFEQLLRENAEARQSFLLLSMQTVAPAELSPVVTHLPLESPSPRLWSRRRALQFVGSGMALGLLGVAGRFGWQQWNASRTFTPVQVSAVRGLVRLLQSREQVVAGRLLPAGSILNSIGNSSSVVLSYPDGSRVSITGNSSLVVGATGRKLTLRQGTATAEVRPPREDEAQLVLSTPAASLTSNRGASVTLGTGVSSTEVGVQTGAVFVSDAAGEHVAEVRTGEILLMRPGKESAKEALPPTPSSFRWNLNRPLPDGWAVGHREESLEGPAVRPEFWYDPYHSAILSQIRSDNQWTRGFVVLYPDSLIRIRYWVDQPGRGQLVMCVRTLRPNLPASGVLEVNDAFVHSKPGKWQWLEARPRDMLDHKEAPGFGPPWIAFLIIFNTYQIDLGLRVADLRVSRNGDVLHG